MLRNSVIGPEPPTLGSTVAAPTLSTFPLKGGQGEEPTRGIGGDYEKETVFFKEILRA